MRKMWATGAAMLVLLALSELAGTVLPAQAETAGAVWVTGTGSIPVEVEAGATQAGDVLGRGCWSSPTRWR